MFGGEELVRFQTSLSLSQVEDAVITALERLGSVDFQDRGYFKITARKLQNFATDVSIDGQLTKGRKPQEYTCRVSYNVQPSAMCWIIAVVGFLFCVIGPLILIMPFLAKSEVQRAVESATRDLQYEFESESDRRR